MILELIYWLDLSGENSPKGFICERKRSTTSDDYQKLNQVIKIFTGVDPGSLYVSSQKLDPAFCLMGVPYAQELVSTGARYRFYPVRGESGTSIEKVITKAYDLWDVVGYEICTPEFTEPPAGLPDCWEPLEYRDAIREFESKIPPHERLVSTGTPRLDNRLNGIRDFSRSLPEDNIQKAIAALSPLDCVEYAAVIESEIEQLARVLGHLRVKGVGYPDEHPAELWTAFRKAMGFNG